MPASVSKPLDWFKPDPQNPRKFSDPEDLRQLAESLKKRQLVLLIAREDGTIIDGHRRYFAATLDGRPTHLDTVVVPAGTTDGQIDEMRLILPLHSVGLEPIEVHAVCRRWFQHHEGATAKELAAAIDKSPSYLSGILSLDRCIGEVREAAAQGRICLSHWRELAALPEAEQAAQLAAILSGEVTSREQLKRRGRKPSSQVRIHRAKYQAPSGVCVTLSAEGEGLSLDDVEETLVGLLKEVREGKKLGLDSKTLVAVLRDKANAGV